MATLENISSLTGVADTVWSMSSELNGGYLRQIISLESSVSHPNFDVPM